MKQKQRRIKKPGHVPVLIRNMPEDLHFIIKKTASLRETTMTGLILVILAEYTEKGSIILTKGE